MAKKPKAPTPIAMCEVSDCTEIAVCSFRQYQDAEGFTTHGLVLISKTDCCDNHVSDIRRLYSGKDVIQVDLSKA
jgi:hypothetical protein